MIPCRAAVLKYAPGWARANGISSVIPTAQTRVDTLSRCAWSVERCVLLLHRAVQPLPHQITGWRDEIHRVLKYAPGWARARLGGGRTLSRCAWSVERVCCYGAHWQLVVGVDRHKARRVLYNSPRARGI
jgi:hypothetical protein